MCYRCLQKQSGGSNIILFFLILFMLVGRLIEIPLEILGLKERPIKNIIISDDPKEHGKIM